MDKRRLLVFGLFLSFPFVAQAASPAGAAPAASPSHAETRLGFSLGASAGVGGEADLTLLRRREKGFEAAEKHSEEKHS